MERAEMIKIKNSGQTQNDREEGEVRVSGMEPSPKGS